MHHSSEYIFIAIISLLAFNIPSPALAVTKQKNISALEQCYEIIGSKPRTALAACFTKMQATADEGLKTQLAKTRKEIAETDSSGRENALKSLDKSQELFLEFRNSECRRVSDAAFGGSGAGDFQQACFINLTNWRIKQLKQ